ncbi:MAG: hypothetical protein WCK47_14020 [bacterium]
MMKNILSAVSAASLILIIGAQAGGMPGAGDDLTSIAAGDIEFLSESQAGFSRGANEWAWISDAEHMFWKSTNELFLADARKPYYITGDTIPANRDFELFPYHYFSPKEAPVLGNALNYKLIAQNRTTATVTLEIRGQGVTTEWEHAKAWEGALRGEGRKTVTLAPGEIFTFWEARGLKPGLPWSAIVLGRADGNLWVCDYCWRGEKDPGVANAKPMPDLAWPPYLLASFTRGAAEWNSAGINILPGGRTPQGSLPLSVLIGAPKSIAFGYSPGGPITKLCEYKAVQPTFNQDNYYVKDPVSGYEHVFFGGNYPVRYKLPLPLENDTEATRTVSLYLASNDKFNVDSIAGVWSGGRFLSKRVPGLKAGRHWRIFRATLYPRARMRDEIVIVPLGSRWGGLVATLIVN